MKKTHNSNLLSTCLDELVEEATDLFSTFDAMSLSICEVEKKLNGAKAYFPFKYRVRIEEDPVLKKFEARHNDISFENSGCEPMGYAINIHWYLMWEKEENTKNYRVFLVAEEKEVVHYLFPGGEGSSCMDFDSKYVFKKPLMETSLSVRMQYAEHLIPFIEAFTSYLRECRIKLVDNNPF